MQFLSNGLIPHEFIRVKIGGRGYMFRTMSWVQLLSGQQALKTLARELLPLQAKSPDEITEADNAAITPALEKIFKIICPELALINDECGVAGCDNEGSHADYLHLNDSPAALASLMGFYLKHDWKKLKDFLEAGDEIERELTPQEAMDTVATIGRMVSVHQNIDRMAFNDLRFEEVIDLINQSHREWDEAAGKEGRLRVKDWLDRAGNQLGPLEDCEAVTLAPGFAEMFTPSKTDN